MKSPAYHLMVLVSVFLVVAVGYSFWYLSIVNKSAEVAELQNQINIETESASRIVSARTALAEIAGDKSAIRSYFVPETEIVSFINDLEDRGRRLNTTVKVLSVSTNDSNSQRTLVFSLLIKGSFDAVMRTIGVIEYAPYNLFISKLSLGKDEKNLWLADLEILVGSIPSNEKSI